MELIKFFLGKYQNLVSSDAAVKKFLRDAVKKYTGFDLPSTDIQISNFTLYVKTKPALKSEIFIKRELILEELKKNLEKSAPGKII